MPQIKVLLIGILLQSVLRIYVLLILYYLDPDRTPFIVVSVRRIHGHTKNINENQILIVLLFFQNLL